MPRLVTATASPQRAKEELEAYRASLPRVENHGCGHFGVAASAYYSTGKSSPPGGGRCVECYREFQREGHRRRRGEGNFLTIEDIRNPKRKSGFDHVHYNDLGRNPQSAYLAVAYGGSKDASGKSWRGPRRATAEEAAQDYCDYANLQSGAATPALPTFEPPKIDLGTVGERVAKQATGKVERKAYTGPHDLYDVVMYDTLTGNVIRRKVGITARGNSRYDGTARTWGVSFAPMCRAITYPNKAAAERAERQKIAEVAQDPEWRMVAKECFAPVNERNIYERPAA